MVYKYIVTTFYKFTKIENICDVKLELYKACKNNSILGTILIAEEGINATICGQRESIDAFYESISKIENFNDLEFKEAFCESIPFTKLKIKIKDEIIKFGVQGLDYNNTGKHLTANAWEELIDSDSIIIDARNNYEVNLGTFKNAVNPNTRNFTQLAQWIDENLTNCDIDKPIGMFCTGGVRCEKSTAYLMSKGFKKVYQLEGGIIQYLKDSSSKKQYWKGNCFVFDNRIAIDENLKA